MVTQVPRLAPHKFVFNGLIAALRAQFDRVFVVVLDQGHESGSNGTADLARAPCELYRFVVEFQFLG
jgi:hypothetical protein